MVGSVDLKSTIPPFYSDFLFSHSLPSQRLHCKTVHHFTRNNGVACGSNKAQEFVNKSPFLRPNALSRLIDSRWACLMLKRENR